MKISLVIIAYNEEKYIGQCLNSVLENGAGLFEIIVVNNSSTDKTESIARGFPGVKVITESVKGTSNARHRGFLESKGDIIAFLDADTKMPIHWIDKVKFFLNKDDRIVCLTGPYVYYDMSLFGKFITWLCYKLIYWPTYLLVGYLVVGGNFVARRSALEAIGGLDSNIKFYGDDTDIGRRLHKVGKVKFMLKFYMYSSARRIKKEGAFMTSVRYSINFLWVVFTKKPLTTGYKEVR